MRAVALYLTALALLCIAGPSALPQKKDPYADHIAPTGPKSPAEQKKVFRLPPGFEIQLVASEPDIKKPINIAFDARGRLWVTQSVEYPHPVKGIQPTRDSVAILEDFASDGKARKITTFADNLNIPIGVLPHGDGAIVYTIPHIVRLRDPDKTGKATKRDVVYSGYGFADTHGMTGEFVHGFDGWVYACHGFSNKSIVDGKPNARIEMQSGNTYRFKADGSKIEYFTHGQVNPFGLTLDPLGNFYSCDCHTQPVYQLLKGQVPEFGKPHDGLGFGPEMLTNYKGSTAISGITYYAAEQFPKEYRDTLFFGDVITNQIVQVKFKLQGSTPQTTEVKEFLGCGDKWFRPVDIKLGPDGALYVADFYTPIIGHYEVPLNHPKRDNQHGRIWRIVYKGLDGKTTLEAMRDLTKGTIEQLVKDLGHPNLTVRLTATHQLVDRGGKEVIEGLKAAIARDHAETRVHALWALARLNALTDDQLAEALASEGPTVAIHALKILAERADCTPSQRKLAIRGLASDNAHLRRAAAEALGVHDLWKNLRPLLDSLKATPAGDTHLTHVLRMALRDNLKVGDNFAALPGLNLDDRDRRAVADVCLGLTNSEAAEYLFEQATKLPNIGGRLADYVRHIARYGSPGSQAPLAELAQTKFPGNWPLQGEIFHALAKGVGARGAKLQVVDWGESIAVKLLASNDQKQVLLGLELAGVVRTPAMRDPLLQVVLNQAAAEKSRKTALTSLVALDAKTSIPALGKVVGDAANPLPLRDQAAAALGSFNLPEARGELLKVLATAPAKLETTFAMHLAKHPLGAEELLKAVAAGKASPRLLQEQAVLVNLRQAKVKDLDAPLTQLTKGLPAADAALQKLLDTRRGVLAKTTTDFSAGLKVYEKHCANCHQIGSKGAKIGPNLDGLGLRGAERIIEDILDPNRNVDQAFRTTILTLKNGQQVSGLLLREEGAVLVMADAQGKEVRVAKDQVDEQRHSALSPMPANFADQIGETEFAHLLGYLLAQRPDGKR